jgi:hypothetical protein
MVPLFCFQCCNIACNTYEKYYFIFVTRMRFFLIIFCTLIFISATGRPPSNPYSFYAPDLSRLLPFSEEDLKLFRKEKVKRIDTEAEGYYGNFYFNEQGQLIKERTYVMNKKKRLYTDSTTYRYDEQGRLMSIFSKGETDSYDSLAYDNKGRVIYYLSYQIYTEKKGDAAKDIFYELKLENKQGDLYNLVNIADTVGKTVYVTNKENEVIKCVNQIFKGNPATRVDSVARVGLSGKEYTLKYFWKEDKPYQLGQEIHYHNGKVKSQRQYDVSNTTVLTRDLEYLYSEEGSLLQVSDKRNNSKTVFCYSPNGLLTEEISVGTHHLSLARYYYSY